MHTGAVKYILHFEVAAEIINGITALAIVARVAKTLFPICGSKSSFLFMLALIFV